MNKIMVCFSILLVLVLSIFNVGCNKSDDSSGNTTPNMSAVVDITQRNQILPPNYGGRSGDIAVFSEQLGYYNIIITSESLIRVETTNGIINSDITRIKGSCEIQFSKNDCNFNSAAPHDVRVKIITVLESFSAVSSGTNSVINSNCPTCNLAGGSSSGISCTNGICLGSSSAACSTCAASGGCTSGNCANGSNCNSCTLAGVSCPGVGVCPNGINGSCPGGSACATQGCPAGSGSSCPNGTCPNSTPNGTSGGTCPYAQNLK